MRYSENWTDNGSNHVKYCKFGCGEYLEASHNHVETGRQPATCESAEIITYTCDCGNVKTAEGDPALEHNYAWENNGDGTCSAVCQNDASHIIPADVHVDTDEDMMCDNCGADLSCSHEYNSVVTIPAECEKEGEITFTCVHCGDSYTQKIEAKEHNYALVGAFEPTCVTPSIRQYECGYCGNKYTERGSYGDHSYLHTETEPTCTEQGYTTHT